MNILVLGSGGREHALCAKIKKSNLVKKLWCYPGNAGTEKICNKTKLKTFSFEEILDFCKKNKVDLVIPGSEEFLASGITDFLSIENISVLGPSKFASKLETSKVFTKKICHLSNIRTAKWILYENFNEATTKLRTKKFPLVLKMDELAAGKGVHIAKDYKDAKLFLNKIKKGLVGNKKSKILQEELLKGQEASFFFIVDGTRAEFIGSAKDYKRLGDNNIGPNTGGMGCISPSPLENKGTINKVLKKIILPTLETMNRLGYPFRGILYAGLMFTSDDIYLIEYNVRLGDPECQAILSRLKSDFVKLSAWATNKNSKKLNILFDKKVSLCVVMASKGYPSDYKTGYSIKGITTEKNFMIYHAGTKISKKKILVTNGGRVLNIVVNQNNLKLARQELYEKIKKIMWKGSFYRKDIGN